jgi:hypothetical protein
VPPFVRFLLTQRGRVDIFSHRRKDIFSSKNERSRQVNIHALKEKYLVFYALFIASEYELNI